MSRILEPSLIVYPTCDLVGEKHPCFFGSAQTADLQANLCICHGIHDPSEQCSFRGGDIVNMHPPFLLYFLTSLLRTMSSLDGMIC
ncbi:hypothetical protein KP509_05G053100 [Ceratopteris richardii]|nr:hypothetical protein KP509_05G053100 [Ceratopteris richardii]